MTRLPVNLTLNIKADGMIYDDTENPSSTPLLQVMEGMALKNKQQFTLGNYHVQKNGCVIDGKNNHIFLRLL